MYNIFKLTFICLGCLYLIFEIITLKVYRNTDKKSNEKMIRLLYFFLLISLVDQIIRIVNIL